MSKYFFEKNENGATINIQLEHLNICRPEKSFLLSEINIANQKNTWLCYILNNSISFYPISIRQYNSQLVFIFLKVSNGNTGTIVWNLFKVKNKEDQNAVIDVVQVSLLLTLYRFHLTFWSFHYWLWTSKYWLRIQKGSSKWWLNFLIKQAN